VSLVSYRQSASSKDPAAGDVVTYMKWRDASQFEGQLIFADDKDQLKFSMFNVYPYRTGWERLRVIHPDCGCSVRKARGRLRSQIPEGIVVLKQMWEAALRNLDPDASSVKECLLCKSDSSGDGADAKLTCALCLLTFHRQCLAACIADPAGKGAWQRVKRQEVPPAELPREFRHDVVLCQACQVFARNALAAAEAATDGASDAHAGNRGRSQVGLLYNWSALRCNWT
jgi:hypothetical protein